MADGRILIETSLDEKALERQIAGLKTKIAKLTSDYNVGESIFGDAKQNQKKWQEQTAALESEIKKQEALIDNLKSEANKVFGSSDFLGSSEKELQNFAWSAVEGGAQKKSMIAQYQEAQAKIAQIAPQLEDAKAKQSEWDAKVEESTKELDNLNSKLEEAQVLMGELQSQTNSTPPAVKSIEDAFDKVEKKIAQALKRVFLFTVLTKVLSSIKDHLVNALNANEQFAASLAQLRGAVATLAQVIASSLGGALSYILNLATAVITIFARLIALIFGKSIAGAAASAKALNAQAGGYKKVGKAAKDAEKNLASFDEINQLGNKDTEVPDVGGGGGGGIGGFDVSGIKDQISELELYVAGAMLALGAILAFSGVNVPLGIALMAAGAATLIAAAAGAWGDLEGRIGSVLTRIMALVGAFLFAVGLIFVIFGNYPVGIGLMVAGAAALGVAAAGVISNLPEKTRAVLAVIMGIAAAALLALGVILLCTGHIPLGVAALLAGVTALVTAAGIDFSLTESKVAGMLEALFRITSIAFLALGAIFCATGNIPLGVACLVAGAGMLVSASKIDWDEVLRNIKQCWNDIKSWFETNVKPKLTVEYWEGKLRGIGEGLKNALRGPIETVKGWIEGIGQAFSGLGGIFGGFGGPGYSAVHIPGLARGAVIPANAPFLAMLGDQKSGTNIEAPLDTIVQAFRMALSEQGTRQQEAVMVVDNTIFARLVYDLNNQEGKRIGVDLVNA